MILSIRPELSAADNRPSKRVGRQNVGASGEIFSCHYHIETASEL